MDIVINTSSGELNIGENLLYTNDTVKNHQVLYLNFSNINDYHLTLKKTIGPLSIEHVIYDYILEGGDKVLDSTPYIILPGEQIKATSNILGTQFLIQVKIL